MSKKSLKKYANFIDDEEFFREFLPDEEISSSEAEPIESYIFTHSPKYVKVSLRDYQVEGLNWLINMHENGINCILADEMGLGKTLQTISFLGYLKFVKNEKNRHLVVVPKSCLQNWYNEFQKFIPEMNVQIFHVSKAEIKENSKILHDKSVDVILTTYEMCLYSKKYFSQVHWSYVVVDEAHRLKNENSQLSNILRMYKFKHRLLLTGTPLQNNVHELWALLNFILPDFFHDSEKFENFVKRAGEEEQNIEKLRNILQLFFLRREKLDVEKSLLSKKFINLYCPLSEMQREWYRSILKRDLKDLYLNKGIKTTLLNVVMQLKKCCNHPYLFPGAEPEPFETGMHLVKNSGKMAVLDQLLQSLKQKGSRVLVFSQMSHMLDILEDYALFREYNYCRIDGMTSSADRSKSIEEYNAPDSDKFLFLLTTRAGGLGINLYTADTVVIFDSDWNPQADLQAQDRAHRIGQKKQVHVFRLITEDTIEEGIYLRAQQKLKLDDILIQKDKKISSSITEKELMDILSHGIDGSNNDNENIVLEDLIKKGENKEKELVEKMKDFKVSDSKDQKINLYQWEDENYSKNKIDQFVEQNVEEEIEPRFKRTSLFSNRKFKPMIFPEYQFYPKEFYTLQQKEEELFNQNLTLSDEDKQYKEELLKQGFEWTKKDHRAFLSSLEQYFDDIESICKAFPHKSDVREYYKVFMERYTELSEPDRVRNLLERAKNKSIKRSKLKEIFKNYGDELEERIASKNKNSYNNMYLLSLYMKYINDPLCFDRIRFDIINDEYNIGDFYLLSRSTGELSKHINGIVLLILKFYDNSNL